MPRLAPWFTLLLALAAAPAIGADEPSPGCTIVFGQGRNATDNDADANRLWDNVNLAFNARVAARLEAAGGPRVIALVLRVTATDLKGNVEKLLARAAVEGCQRIVETTVFADYAARTLVARIRQYPIVSEPGATADAPLLRIGAPSFVNERNFELTRGTLDRVQPVQLADEMAAEIAAAPASAPR